MTQEDCLNRIKTRLGYPSINLEVTDAAIGQCIEDAVLEVKDYISTRHYITEHLISNSPDGVDYVGYGAYVDLNKIEDMGEVTNVFLADNFNYPYMYDEFNLVNYARRGVPYMYALAVNLRSNVEAMLKRSWRVVGKRLYVDKYYRSVTIEYTPTMVQIDDIEDNWYVSWVLDYATALTKEVLARIRGKFVVDSNPFKTDAADLASEATASKTELKERLAGHGVFTPTR